MLSFAILCCTYVVPATFGCALYVPGYFLLHDCLRKSKHSIKSPERSDKRGLVYWPLRRKPKCCLVDYYWVKYCTSLVINLWDTHWSNNKSVRSCKTPKQTERDWGVSREEGGERRFISHEICVRLVHNKYVHVLLENPRERRRKQNQID